MSNLIFGIWILFDIWHLDFDIFVYFFFKHIKCLYFVHITAKYGRDLFVPPKIYFL